MLSPFLEQLEDRIAPAVLVNGSLEYVDTDGDLVHVDVSKGDLTLGLFTFIDMGGGMEKLAAFDLTSTQFAGSNVSIAVVPPLLGPIGDGLVDVGFINAAGNDLGKVVIGGNLLKITAGDIETPQKGVSLLSAKSLGNLIPADFTQTDRTSNIVGKLGSLALTGDMAGTLFITGGEKAGIGKITVGGSVVGGAGDIAGWIHATGSIGNVSVTGNIDGQLADANLEAGISSSQGKVGKVLIGGSILGGSFQQNGVIYSELSMGAVSIGGDLGKGSAELGLASGAVVSNTGKISKIAIGGDLIGGAGNFTGYVQGLEGIGSVTVMGSILGGAGDDSGAIQSGLSLAPVLENRAIGKVFIGGDLQGGAGARSGSIFSYEGKIGAVFVGEDIQGDAGMYSGCIFSLVGLTSMTIQGSLLGGTATDAGSVQVGNSTHEANIGKVLIFGDVIGNNGNRSADVLAWNGNMSSIWVGGDVIADSTGGGQFNALLYAKYNLGKAEVAGDLIGGDGYFGGRIANDEGKLGAVVVGGKVEGGSGINSGTIYAEIKIASVSIGEADILVGGGLTGGSGSTSGSIQSGGAIGKITINGDLTGGAGNGSGAINAQGGSLGAVTINGDVIGALGDLSGLIFGVSMSDVAIGGNLTGGGGIASGTVGLSTSSSQYIFPSKLGHVTIAGNLAGGAGFRSGNIWSDGDVSSIYITGNISGGTEDQTGMVIVYGSVSSFVVDGSLIGAATENSGYVLISGSVGNVEFGVNIEGGKNNFTGTMYAGELVKVDIGGSLIGGKAITTNVTQSGALISGNIGTVNIGGDIVSGELADNTKTLTDSGAIRSNGSLKKLTVGGSLIGNSDVDVVITARVLYGSVANNLTIGTIDIAHNVTHALILAGTNLSNPAGSNVIPNPPDPNNPPAWQNPYARIGAVIVGGDWTASSISAAGAPGANGYGVGDTLSSNLVAPTLPSGNYSKIGKITIAGTVTGGDPGDQYGFVSQNFGPISIGGVLQSIPAAGGTTDITLDGLVKLHRLTPAA